MYIAHGAIAFWHHFHPWITKNMDLETVSHFATQNHRKSQKCVQSGSQEAPQIHPKIDKTGPLDLNVPIDRSKHLRGPPPRCLECHRSDLSRNSRISGSLRNLCVLKWLLQPACPGSRTPDPGSWMPNSCKYICYSSRYQVPVDLSAVGC